MSRFHDTIREILEEVFCFLNISLNQESLSTNLIVQKDNILVKLKSLQDLYPQLQLSFPELSQYVDQKKHQFTLASPSSPLSYVDMKGQFPYSESSISQEENYASCESEKSVEADNQLYSEFEDSQSTDGYKYTSVPGNKTHYFEKCGFLEKKGKERFGGLLTSSMRRWCGINHGLLFYYDKPTDQAQRGVICLEGYEARPLNMKDKKNGLYFEIVCPGKRSYQFSSSSTCETKEWMDVIDRNSKLLSNLAKPKYAASSVKSDKSVNEKINDDFAEDIYEELDEEEIENNNKLLNANEAKSKTQSETASSPVNNLPSNNTNDSLINYQEFYVGLWDCSADEDNELNFCRGDLIRILSKEYDAAAWWVGELNGKIGFVPKSYLMEAYEVC